MSKRDDDSSADMEVGMTTAERRRRRRRGGGLRVPSDNVPRRSPTTPPVVAPIPEDPSLAMSIAYSFSSGESEPVARVEGPGFGDPMAPEAMQTVIDPPSAPVESADFEMNTREMSAVDLAALGLEDPSGHSHPRAERVSSPGIEPISKARLTTDPSPPPDEDGDVDVDMDTDDRATRQMTALEAPETAPATAPAPLRAPRDRERLRTMALSEEDLEEVREQVRQQTAPAHAKPVLSPVKPAEGSINATQPLTALDLESASEGEKAEPMSVPEIDINELAELAELSDRNEGSGEFEVDVEDVPPPPPASTAERRSRPPTMPPASGANASGATVTPPTPPAQAHAPHGKEANGSGAPPKPAVHKAPPAPPPKAVKPAAVAPAAVVAPKAEGKVPRGKPWFVDLFDEDYLRTLPFLTPQATQAEAEFVIDAMGLQPGAQVLDVGCGYGRHAMELAARGFHMVGLDLSTPLLVRGGEEAMRRGLEINFIRGDMRELDFDAQFDGAYCLFSTFGYFDDETNKKTITNIARALKPGGRVMIEILNRDYVIADLPTRVWWEGEGCVVLEEVELNYFSSRIQVNRSVVFDDGRQLEQEISVRAYSLHEIGKLMHAAGFRVLEVSGGYHTRGRFFGNQSRHIIVLAERKESVTA